MALAMENNAKKFERKKMVIKRKIFLLISVFIYLQSCNAQINQNNLIMEKFNINEFNLNQSDDEYYRVLKDGTTIDQLHFSQGYSEKIVPPKGWFYGYKEFYQNGQLRISGKYFIAGNFKSGIWNEFDEHGKTISNINYDEQYRLDLDSIFKILEDKKIPFSRENKYNKILRSKDNSQATWFVEWQIVYNRIEQLYIDDATGKVIKQDFYNFKSDH